MKRTALRRGSGPKRKTAIRKVARRRIGLSAEERAELKELHRTVVMLRHGAFRFENPSKKDGTPRNPSWRGMCSWCGRDSWLQTCHIFAVGHYPNSRYDPDNAWAGCSYCHLFRWHKDPELAQTWILRLMGEENYEFLRLRVKTASKPDWGLYRIFLIQERDKLLGRSA